jgi:hypothetical protein
MENPIESDYEIDCQKIRAIISQARRFDINAVYSHRVQSKTPIVAPRDTPHCMPFRDHLFCQFKDEQGRFIGFASKVIEEASGQRSFEGYLVEYGVNIYSNNATAPLWISGFVFDDTGEAAISKILWLQVGYTTKAKDWCLGKVALFLYAFTLANTRKAFVFDSDSVREIVSNETKDHKGDRTRHQVIAIVETASRPKGDPVESDGADSKALHVCRGNYATYTEDKPLFGRITGTVWRKSHTRGDAKNGVIVSDYKAKIGGHG